MTYYSMQAIDDFTHKYTSDWGGLCYTDDSVLRESLIVLTGGMRDGKPLKSVVIRDDTPDFYQGHYTVRRYNVLPKKYQKFIEDKEDEVFETYD